MSERRLSELPGWSLAWSDEFDGPARSPVDPAVWQPEVGGHGWGNEELPVVHGTVHGPGYAGPEGVTASFDAGIPLADDFHLYSVAWEPARILWYLDDQLYSTITPDDLQGNPWVFDHDFFLLLSVAVGGTFSVSPDPSARFPQIMLVDYIRVYAGSPEGRF